MTTDTWRKVGFVVVLAAIIGLKVYGFIGGKLAWPLVIALGFVAVITEPTNVGAATLQPGQTAQ